MRVGGFAGTLFNGPIIADVVVGLMEENMPIYVSAQFESMDLDVLTKEVEPPKVKITGIAEGSATLRYGLNGLDDFTVYAISKEGFTLNRDFVEELMFKQDIFQSLGGRRIEKVMRQFIGTAPQRPFDSATMRLGLEDGRVRGTADLRSEKSRDYRGLDLVLEIALDPPVLADALMVLQESDVSKVEF